MTLDIKNAEQAAEFFAQKTTSKFMHADQNRYPFTHIYHRGDKVVAFANIYHRAVLRNPCPIASGAWQEMCFWADTMQQAPLLLIISYGDEVHTLDMRKYPSIPDGEVRLIEGEPCLMLPIEEMSIWRS